MRSHAKASSAGSTEGNGSSRGLFRRALAPRAVAAGSKGSGARSLARIALLTTLTALTAFVALAPAAGAALLPGYGPLGTFDPGGINASYGVGGVAVDDATGNILLIDRTVPARVRVLAPDVTPGSTAVASVLSEFAVRNPSHIAIDQSTGAVYVATLAGNEVQKVNFVNADAGSFTLSFKGQTTPAIPYGSHAGAQAALEALSTIGAGNVVVGGDSSSYSVTFQGALANVDLPQLSIDDSALQPPPPALNVEPLAPGIRNIELANAAGGSFTLSFAGQTTAAIAYGADEPTVQAALEALSTIGAGNVEVTPGGNVEVTAGGPYTVTFKGPLAETETQLSGNGAELAPLTPSATVQTASAGAPNGVIRYLSDGAPVPTYTFDPSFTFPSLTLSSYGGPLAVDPTTHDLLVGDGDHVNRYSSAGALLGSFDGSDSPGGKFTTVRDIAVGASSTYVLDLQSGEPVGGGVSRIVQLDDQGVYERTLIGAVVPDTIAVDAHDRLVAVGRTGAFQAGAQLFTFGADGTVESVGAIAGAQHYVGGVAADRGASERVYVATNYSQFYGGTSGLSALQPGPGVHLDQPSGLSPEGVHLSGLVNPEGKATEARFEYCSDRDPCATNTTLPWTPTPDVAIGAGSDDEPVSVELTGLFPHTRYSVRLTATDTQTSVSSPAASFLTADAPPRVATGSVSDVSQTTATVNGTVTPQGIQTTYYFEYGESAAYGARIPAEGSGIAGSGYLPRSVGRQLIGLTPGTLYHYRIVAVNAAGTSLGEDRTITTDAADQPPRGYEQVSPVEKQGVPVSTDFAGVRASADGDALMYGSSKTPFPGAESAPLVPRAIATRTADAWTNATLDLPFDNLVGNQPVFFSTISVSSDARSALVVSNKKLTPAAVEDEWNLYIRRPGVQSPSEEFTLVASDPLLGAVTTNEGAFRLVGTSDDLRTTVFSNGAYLYEAVLGEGLSPASVLPDDSLVRSEIVNPSATDPHQVSTDGSRIYFGAKPGGGSEGPLYLRENGTTTIPISVSHRSGASAEPVSAEFLGASPDGRYVEFTTFCGTSCVPDGLTADAPDGAGIYRYDVDTDSMKFLAPGNAAGAIVPRPALGALFFRGGYIHDGITTPVPSDGASNLRGSDNGRYYVFLSPAKLTSYENAGHPEFYLYDSLYEGPVGPGEEIPAGSLTCASCRTDGGPPTGVVQIGEGTGESALARSKPRVVLDNGMVFFDTPAPLVGGDSNGTRDVYVYQNGRARLISRGKYPTNSQFQEATPDGSDVFFSTDDKLVGQDQDTTKDMYDARIGGGIAAQNPSPPHECVRDDCKATPGAGPELPFGGSEAVSGFGNVPAQARKRCGKSRHQVKSRGKTRCVKQQKKSKRANTNRRQAR